MRATVCLGLLICACAPVLAQGNWGVLEDFEFGFLSPWALFGDPQPVIVVGAEELGSNVMVPNGDDRCPSGIRLLQAAPWGPHAGFAVDFATDVASDGRRDETQELLFGVFDDLLDSGGCSPEDSPRALVQLRVDSGLSSESVCLLQGEQLVASRAYPADQDRVWHQLWIQQIGSELVAGIDGEELGRVAFPAPSGLKVFLSGRHPAIVHVFDDLRYLQPQQLRVRDGSFGGVKALYRSGRPRAMR